MSTGFAQIPIEKDFTVDVTASAEIASLEQKRVIFFCGDAITPREKFEFPEIKGAGGVYMPHIHTLPKTRGVPAAHGMIYKCKFTALQSAFEPEWEMMLPPGERKHYPQSFVEDGGDGKVQISGFLGSDVNHIKETGEFKNRRHGDVRYKKWMPGQDIHRVTARSMPFGVGGVVEITALAGASASEITDAQVYFFPNWEQIRAGLESLPSTVREIEAHIRERQTEIDAQPWSSDKKTKYKAIAQDMLKSCALFRQSAVEIIEQDDVTKTEAAKKGEMNARHSPVSEMLLGQVEWKRKGDLLAGESSSTAELVRELAADRKDRNDAIRLEQENRAKELEIRERELALKEAQLYAQLKQDDEVDEPSQVDATANVAVPQESDVFVAANDLTSEVEETSEAATEEVSFPFPTTKPE